MEGFKRQLKFQYLDAKKAFVVFWAIVLLSDVLFHVLNYTTNINSKFGIYWSEPNINQDSVNVAGGNAMSILIFILVSCVVMYYKSFPAAIGFSSTRKDFYKGVIGYNVMISLAMSVIEAVLLKADRFIVRAMGGEALTDLMYFNCETDSIFYIIIIVFLLTLLFTSMFNLVGIFVYKIGYKFWIGFGILFMMVGNIKILSTAILSFATFIASYNDFITFFIKVIITIVLLHVIAWGFVRKLSIKSNK
ncbi:hypothetical protein [Clostridium amazonitimonense]|uniref:hypothetical protein n=1 Tax=Clostridium amazonitimonense TaxID=1499689 RepID=UPI0005097527|nr:hypothetical protein [Clostridium amazonitimonense]